MDILQEKWDDILYTVKSEHELSDMSFKTWLKTLEILSISDHKVSFLVPTGQMGIDYITKKYLIPLNVAIAEVTGTEYEIELLAPEQAHNLENKKMFASVNHADNSANVENANLNPKYTFDTFVVTRRGLSRCRISGKNVQSSVYPRGRRTWQNTSDARHRTLYIRRKPGQTGALRDK